jgi:cytosine/adenosine deaminase-related metal-dependent hydrolase
MLSAIGPWLLASAVAATAAGADQPFDLVIRGGRVMDPESGTDAVRDVGIADGKIVRIAPGELRGRRVLEAKGLVVAPGFIDLHQHGQDLENDRAKVQDGVTTALELEIGPPDVAAFLRARAGQALLNYGTSASHPWARVHAWGGELPAPGSGGDVLPPAGPATDEDASPERIRAVEDRLRGELLAGGLGVGLGINYTPGASRLEIIETFRVAAERGVPLWPHMRAAGYGFSIESVAEVIAAAAVTGAPLHIVHINSMGLGQVFECLKLIEGARAHGLDVTVEAYPYGWGQTMLGSAFFNPGWRERMRIDYSDLRLVQTGETLTAESFERLRSTKGPVAVLVRGNPDERVDAVIRHPLVMVASDGYLSGGKGHPRTAGTFSRILARYVRELRTVTLMDALRKMSLMPAQRLEAATPAAHNKGRIREGADADVVVFDPDRVADHATYDAPALPSTGFRYVLVGGVAVVDEGRLVDGVHPGRPLTGR